MDLNNQNINNSNMEMGWDDIIESDGQSFVVLKDGEYNFKVTGFERGRFPGSAKIPACNKAALTLTVESPEGKAAVKTDIILYRSLEWRISSFFRCIGQKKHGERVAMDWSKVIGSEGRARFKTRTYTDKWGETRQANEVDYFIDYDPKFFSTASAEDDSDIPF